MTMTLEQKRQHPVASRIPMTLWQKYCHDFPENWDASAVLESPLLRHLKRQDLPQSPLQALIVLLITHNHNPIDKLIPYALNQLNVDFSDIVRFSKDMGDLDIFEEEDDMIDLKANRLSLNALSRSFHHQSDSELYKYQTYDKIYPSAKRTEDEIIASRVQMADCIFNDDKSKRMHLGFFSEKPQASEDFIFGSKWMYHSL